MLPKNLEGGVNLVIKLIKDYESESNKRKTQLVKFLIMESQTQDRIDYINKVCLILKGNHPEYYHRIEKIVDKFGLPLLNFSNEFKDEEEEQYIIL